MKKVLLLFSFMLITGAFLKAQTVDVTFQVDMTVEIARQNFNPSTNQVELRGSFDSWGAGLVMSDADNDTVYTVTVTGQPQNTAISYKFYHTGKGGTWEGDPNREVNSGTSATLEVPVDYFNRFPPPSGDPTNVTFEVDMRLPARQAVFTPGTHKVFVAGNFSNWQSGNPLEMFDADTDSIYSIDADTLTSGQLLQYKYIYALDSAKNGTWEGGDNRTFFLVDGDNLIHRFWEDKDPNIALADGNILFRLDMSVFEEIGIYDPENDSLRLRSSFNGWNDGADPSQWRMNQGVTNPLRWTLNVPFELQPVDGQYFYKYFLAIDPPKSTLWTDFYERPASRGGGNRTINFEGEASQQDSLYYYDDIKPDYVIPDGTNLQVTFRVNMTGASSAGDAATFNPAADKVYWLSEMPSFIYSQGWADNDTMRVLELTDGDGDLIYEGTLTVQDPAFNTFEYRYAFATDSSWGRESDGGPGHVDGYRVRFVGQDAERSFPVNPWTMPVDTWNDGGTHTDQESDPYTSLVGVKEIDLPAMTYKLEQNFPNPFNPATVIRFSIPEQGLVTLKVYNVLGEQVTTLFNGELRSGTYDVDFNASSLSSGVYFYTVTANNFVSTKKMLLLK